MLRLAGTPAKRFEIQNVNVAVRRNLNHSDSPQPREFAGNCSNRQAEKVSNFGACKRKIESRSCVASRVSVTISWRRQSRPRLAKANLRGEATPSSARFA